MKKIMLIAGVALLAACTENDEPFAGGDPVLSAGDPVVFDGGFVRQIPSTGNGQGVAMKDEDGVRTEWQENDLVGITGYDGATSLGENYAYEANFSDDASCCAFMPADEDRQIRWDGEGTPVFYAYYPYREGAVTGTTLALSLPERIVQTDGGMAHVAASIPLVAEPVRGVRGEESVSLRFGAALAVLQLRLKASDAVTLASVRLESGRALSGTIGIDLTRSYTECIETVDGSNGLTVVLGEEGVELPVDGSTVDVYIPVVPESFPAGSVSLTFTDRAGATFTKTIWNDTERTFVANKKYVQAIKALSSADFAAMRDFAVTAVGGDGASVFAAGDPRVEGTTVTVPFTTRSDTPAGRTAFSLDYSYSDAAGESRTGTLEFADVREAEILRVGSVDYTVRVEYLPQLPNADLNDASAWATANNTFATGTTFDGGHAVLTTGYSQVAGIFYPATKGITSASLYTGSFAFDAGAATKPRTMTTFGIPFVPSAPVSGIRVWVKYHGAPKGDNGQLDVDFGSVLVELIAAGAGDYVYHGYGTDGTGPATDLTGTVRDDEYGSTATRVASGVAYLYNGEAGQRFTINGVQYEGTCLSDSADGADWAEVFVPVAFIAGEREWDYLSVSFASSAMGDSFNGNPDSALQVDRVEIVYEE